VISIGRAEAARAVLLLAGCATVEVLAWRLATSALPPAAAAFDGSAPLGPQGIAALMTALAAILLLLAWSWLGCATVLVVGDLLRQGTRPGRACLGVPEAWQRAVAVLLGAGAVCIPGAAVADGSRQAQGDSEPVAARIDGLPLPDRPSCAGAVDTAAGHAPSLPASRCGHRPEQWGRTPAPAGCRDCRAGYEANAAALGDDPTYHAGNAPASPGAHSPQTNLAAGRHPAQTEKNHGGRSRAPGPRRRRRVGRTFCDRAT
jgi:hypothetical protein